MKRSTSFVPEEVIQSIGDTLPKEQPSSSPQTDPSPKTDILRESFGRSLDEAANQLIGILPSSLKDYIFELADTVLKIPRWQLLLGAVVAQNECGNLTNPSIDPSWRQVEYAISQHNCEYQGCGKVFIPLRFGQKFCSSLCGNLYRKEDIDKKNKERDRIQKQLRKTGRAEVFI